MEGRGDAYELAIACDGESFGASAFLGHEREAAGDAREAPRQADRDFGTTEGYPAAEATGPARGRRPPDKPMKLGIGATSSDGRGRVG